MSTGFFSWLNWIPLSCRPSPPIWLRPEVRLMSCDLEVTGDLKINWKFGIFLGGKWLQFFLGKNTTGTTFLFCFFLFFFLKFGDIHTDTSKQFRELPVNLWTNMYTVSLLINSFQEELDSLSMVNFILKAWAMYKSPWMILRIFLLHGDKIWLYVAMEWY